MLCNLTLLDLRILKITFDFESSFLNLCLLWMPIGNCELKRRRSYLYVALFVLHPLTQRAIKLFLLLTFARPLFILSVALLKTTSHIVYFANKTLCYIFEF